jgi:outer membrane protein assembly factor BamB
MFRLVVRARCGALAAVFAFVCVAPAPAADWPEWRGPGRNGAAPASPSLVSSLPTAGLKPIWKSENLPGGFAGGWGSPIVADGRVYLFVHYKAQKTPGELPKRKFPYLADDKRGGMTPAQYEEYEKNRRAEDLEFGKLYDFKETTFAFDAADGKTLWKNERTSVYSRFVQSGTLTLHDGKLYVLGAGLTARCIDAATGKDVWTRQLPGEFTDEFYMSSFVVADGVAVVGAGTLFGLDAAGGEVRWKTDPAKVKVRHSSPALLTAGKLLVVANVGGATAAFDPATGKELWRVSSEANESTPVVVGDRRRRRPPGHIRFEPPRRPALLQNHLGRCGRSLDLPGCGRQGEQPRRGRRLCLRPR